MDQKPPFDFKDFKDFKPPKMNVKVISTAAAIIVILGLFFSLWFTVEPEEVWFCSSESTPGPLIPD